MLHSVQLELLVCVYKHCKLSKRKVLNNNNNNTKERKKKSFYICKQNRKQKDTEMINDLTSQSVSEAI